MILAITYVFYVLWSGFCWVLRGGLFNNLQRRITSKNVGTDVGRFVAATLMIAPLVFFNYWAIVAWPFLVAAMKIGYFDGSMGLEQPGRDHAFLALWGFTVALIATSGLGLIWTGNILPTVNLSDWAFIGALAVAAYAVNKPFGRRFGTDWTERAEYLTGCAIGTAMLGTTL
jgi:hypothetical protein